MKKIICTICAIVIVMTLSVPSVFAKESDRALIEAQFEEYKDEISGAAIIQIEDGEISDEYYYGLIDIENNIAVDESTVFEWASITKLLTWTSVMQLVEQGKIELDRDIRDYLSEALLSKLSYDKPITMLNLMHHNAGWAEAEMDDVFDPSEIIDLDAALKKFEPRQIYEPGTVVAYSNYGVALAGYVVECVSGKPCWQYINENIFAPLGMKNTAVHPTQRDNPGVGAARDKEKGYDYQRNYIAEHRGYGNLYPCGSAIGTIEDLAKFAMALMPPEGSDCTLFQKRETLEFMLTPSLFYPDGSPENAHGFWTEWRGGKEFYGHGGNYIAFSCNLLFAPETREALVVMTNTMGEYPLCHGLMDKIFGPEDLPYGPKIGAGTAKEVTGIYVMARRQVDTSYHVVDYRLFEPITVTAKDDYTIEFFSEEYKQVAPCVFKSERGNILRFASENGKVTKIAIETTDLIKRPTWQIVYDYSLFGLAVLSIIYCLVMLCASGLRKIIKKPEKSRLRMIRNIACVFGLAVGMNWGLLKLMTDAGRIHEILFMVINALTLPVFAAYVWFFIKTDKKECFKADVRLGIVAGICLLTELTAVVSFNLWR